MRKITTSLFQKKIIVALLFFIGATLNTFAQCPTIPNPEQTFCDSESPTVSNLIATDAGGGIRWYDAADATTPLSNTYGLQNGKTYYVDDSTGSCGTRQSVQVTIYGPPTSIPFQGVCVDYQDEATVSDLFAIGNDLLWFDVPSGGEPLAPSTIITDGSLYYVNQKNPDTGCRSSRYAVRVQIGVVPVPTGNPIQQFCADSNATVADLVASGNNKWYSTLSSGEALPLSTPLVNGENYYATTVDVPCESSERFEVTVEIVPLNDAGNNGEIEICESGVGSTPPMNLFDALLGSPELTGVWTGPVAVTNNHLGTVDVSSMTASGSPYIFTYAVSSDTCPTDSATVSIRITESGNAGENGNLNLCVNSSATDLFDSLDGSPEYGGIWFPALASGTGVFDPLIDAPGIYSYTVLGVPPCGSATASVTVSVSAEPIPGINGNLTLCSNSSPQNLFDSLGGSPQSGGVWSPGLTSGTGIFDPSQDAAGVYTYTVLGTSPCPDATAAVTVTITPLPNPGTNGSLTLCSFDSPKNLFDSLGGNPESGGTWSPELTSGTGVFDPTQDASGIYTYTVNGTSPCGSASATVSVTVNPEAQPGTSGSLTLCMDSSPADLFESLGGTPHSGGTWTPALASGTGIFDPTQDVAGIYTYTINGLAPCPDAMASVTVTVNPLADAGSNGNLTLCSNASAQDLWENLGGSPETGGTWSPALASGTGVFNPSIDAPGVYVYTVKGRNSCADATASVTVTVNPEADPGTNGTLALCIESTPQDLFNSLGGTPQPGGTWLPSLASGTGVFDPLQDAPGIYIYTITGTAPCQNASASVSVSVSPLTDAGTNGSLIICSSDAPINLFDSLNGTPQGDGYWTPALASGTNIFNPSVDSAGIYTYTVSGIPPCGNATATVEVIVNPGVDVGFNGELELCMSSSPQDLFNSLGGTPQTGGIWTPALSSGTGIFNPLQDSPGVYTYTIVGDAPCGDASSTVTVTVNPLPDAGSNGSLIICSSDIAADLWDSLGGTPETGGTWSPALSSGTGLFDPSKDSSGLYTYTVAGESPCAPATATVEVTVNPGVDPGKDATLELCSTAAPADLFDSLSGTPQTGGTWSPALASGTGIFDPTKDSAGVYTYTIAGIPPCGNASATVTVVLNPLLDPGINATLVLCENSSPESLFDSLGGTPVTGGVWSPMLVSGTGVFDPSLDGAGIYTYTVTTDCGEAKATIEVTVNPLGNPGINGNLAVCLTGAPVDLFTGLQGTPQMGGTWSPTLASGSGVFDPSLDAAGIYTYTVLGTAPCGESSATVQVTFDTTPQAGFNGRFAICTNDMPKNLFESLGGTPDAGGIWSPALASGSGIFDPALDIGGLYTYTVTNACGTNSAVVTVALINEPDIVGMTLSANNICLGEDLNLDLSGASRLDDGNYNLTYSLSGTNTIEQTIIVYISNGTATLTIPAAQLLNSGVSTFTILDLLNPITKCGATTTLLPKVSFEIEHAQTPQLIEEGHTFCIDDNPTIKDLTSRLLGVNMITWYDSAENGTPYAEADLLEDGVTYYAYNTTPNGCSAEVRLAVKVVVDSCEPLGIIIPDGFSPNGDNINDEFLIKNLRERYPNFKLQIYNRYGNILYKGNASTPNWDGSSNQGRAIGNGILPVGVYYYILELKDTNNKTIQGSVYLNR